jgi:pyruvate/2-oxoglutarate dehydrogenase complex dihydrolipoamide acyltransferase (E2) component
VALGLVGVLALIVVGGVAAGNGADPKPRGRRSRSLAAPSMPPLSQEQKDANAKASTAPKAPPAPTATVVPVPPAAPKLTVSQQNAVESARSYLDSQGFSRLGLIGQLTGFEGYSTADATFAVDYVHADWNKQAVRVAQGYLDSGSFSRSGLITQLTQFEKFTRAQAVYAADKVGL